MALVTGLTWAEWPSDASQPNVRQVLVSQQGSQTKPAPPHIAANNDPIYWPGGNDDAAASVILFLDEYFAEWRALDLDVVVTDPTHQEGMASTRRAHVEVRNRVGEVFANVPLRFSDGRWFLEEISSPAFNVQLFGVDRHMEGSVISEMPGIVNVELIYAFERRTELAFSLSVPGNQTGEPIAISAGEYHQEVHASLLSGDGRLLAITVFTAHRQVR